MYAALTYPHPPRHITNCDIPNSRSCVKKTSARPGHRGGESPVGSGKWVDEVGVASGLLIKVERRAVPRQLTKRATRSSRSSRLLPRRSLCPYN